MRRDKHVDAETENSLVNGATAGTNRRGAAGNRSSLEPANVSNLEDVRQIQQYLMDLGYNINDANGMMSSETQQAIREFQFLNDLPVTGNVDEPTKIAINTQWEGTGAYNAQVAVREKPSNVEHENKDASERVHKAAAVLQDLTASADKRVPNEILQRAEAIAVIPNMIKGAFGIGGRFGKGVVSERAENGRWSPPAFIDIGGGSFGAQIGVTSTDLVLVFTDRKAMNMLEGGKDLKLGVDAGVVAGPIGREAEAGVNANLSSAIYAYSRAKGLFAGVALDGAVLSIDKDMNQKVYGSSVDAKQVLDGNVAANTTVRPFLDALDKVVPKKRISQR